MAKWCRLLKRKVVYLDCLDCDEKCRNIVDVEVDKEDYRAHQEVRHKPDSYLKKQKATI